MKNLITKNDFLASLGVFVIALPLTLGIALASGVPIKAAIISAILGGVLVGAFSGAPLAVTGPAAGLTVIVFDIVRAHGLGGLAVATMIAGLIQFAFGFLKLGSSFRFVPHSVLDGMLAAIGLMIACGQLYVVFGQTIPNGFIQSAVKMPAEVIKLFNNNDEGLISQTGVVIAVITIGIQLLWGKFAKKYSYIPGAVIALIVVTIAFLPFNIARISLQISATSVLSASKDFALSGISSSAISDGFLLAIVGSIESLATASALSLYVKKFQKMEMITNLNKELQAQGIGNFFAGILGGIPISSVIVRSAANVQYGAKTRASTILHGVWILIAVILLGPVLNSIPLPALASILIMTGIRLLNLKVFMEHFKNDVSHAICYVGTFAGILSTSLLKGIILGLCLSLIFKAFQSFKSRNISNIRFENVT